MKEHRHDHSKRCDQRRVGTDVAHVCKRYQGDGIAEPAGDLRQPKCTEVRRPKKLDRGDIEARRGTFRKISGRNQLIGRVVAIKFSGLLAQVTMAIGEQHITSIITADAAKELRLKPGERAAALIKSTEVMILRV